jgi:carboxypeptidase C (cathepsin A)
MNQTVSEKPAETKEYQPPKGVQREMPQTFISPKFPVEVTADWMVLRKKEKPAADMFFVSYELAADKREARPVTFVFNGGPGAASAYLHVGALGPNRVAFSPTGEIPPSPVPLVDNHESWLHFSDLVFVDPVGTGFSRVLDESGFSTTVPSNGTVANADEAKEYYQLNRDLDATTEFIKRYLSRFKRWSSPVYIAGESYGGFRVGKLLRRLQESGGVGITGAILISPALDIGVLDAHDYELLSWIDVFPSMSAAAFHHKRSRAWGEAVNLGDVLKQAENFAKHEFSALLLAESLEEHPQEASKLSKVADMLGLPLDLVKQCGGRVDKTVFVRQLLSEQGKICGLYDASITAIDPFPHRPMFQGPDPTLASLDRAFATGINAWLRDRVGVETDRDYRLLSYDVNKLWRIDGERHGLDSRLEAMDDFRYGLSLNPHAKIFITHGIFDLITPYASSERLLRHARLHPELARHVTTRHFRGGHMFYTWDSSRKDFFGAMKTFFGNNPVIN